MIRRQAQSALLPGSPSLRRQARRMPFPGSPGNRAVAQRLVLCGLGVALLSGCAALENRLSCPLAGGEALYTSLYGPLGVTSKIARQDAVLICGPKRKVSE